MNSGTTLKYLNSNFKIAILTDKISYFAKSVKVENGYFATAYTMQKNKIWEGLFADKKLNYRNGTFAFFDTLTSNITEKGSYSYNVPNGVWQRWYSNNNKMDSGRYYYNKLISKWKYWHINGKLMASVKYADSFATPKGVCSGLPKEERPTAIANYCSNYFDDVIKVGLWQTFYSNGLCKDSIYYNVGKESGQFKAWYKNGKLESEGLYDDSKKTGNWNFYYENGNFSTKEIYESNKIINLQCFDSLGNYQNDFCGIQKPAMFPGGPVKFDDYITNKIPYPEAAKTLLDNAVVHCEFTIDVNGKIKNIKCGDSPNIYFIKAIEVALNRMPLWEPAISHNRFVDYDVQIDVLFILTKQ